MATKPQVLDSDFKYIDKKGNLLKSRTELAVSQMLSFLKQDYQYGHKITLNNLKTVFVDFKTQHGLIEVIDSDEDITKYKMIKEQMPDTKIMAIGHPKYAGHLKELDEIMFYDAKDPQTGSIFLEDP